MYKYQSFENYFYESLENDMTQSLNQTVDVPTRVHNVKIAMCSAESKIRGVIFYCDAPPTDKLTGDIEWNLELIEIESGNESAFEEAYRKVQECLNDRVSPEKNTLTEAQCHNAQLFMSADEKTYKGYKLVFAYPIRKV